MAALAKDSRLQGAAGWRVMAGGVAGVCVLMGLELIAPPNVTLGPLVLLLVVVCSLLLDMRRLMVIVALAGASRIADAWLDDIPFGLAALECGSFVVAAAIGLALRNQPGHDAAQPGSISTTPHRGGSNPTTFQIGAAQLTLREHEVLQMAMQGLTAAQVAERLFISKRTVETHLERAYGKLGVKSKRELIASAFDARAAPSS